jgi:hypothetical protein
MKEIDNLQESLDRIKQLFKISSKQRYTFEETSEICEIISCKLVKAGRKNILFKNELRFYEGTLAEIVEFCFSQIL